MRIELIQRQNDAILVIFPIDNDDYSMNFTISRSGLYSLFIKLREMFQEAN